MSESAGGDRDSMVEDNTEGIHDLSKSDLIRLAGIFLGEALAHYGLWYAQAVHHLSLEEANAAESEVLKKYAPVALRRLAPHFGIPLEGSVPRILFDKNREELIELIEDIGKTWLASDGIWFQEIEARKGMFDAKMVNDHCWAVFGRMEAKKLRAFLDLAGLPSLKLLEKALRFRIYTAFNDHESYWEDEDTFVWRMLQCRVQETRRRKGLEDYPCKSAGVIEYTRFAQGIDPLIKTECVLCPPDEIPDGVFCAWRFSMKA